MDDWSQTQQDISGNEPENILVRLRGLERLTNQFMDEMVYLKTAIAMLTEAVEKMEFLLRITTPDRNHDAWQAFDAERGDTLSCED